MIHYGPAGWLYKDWEGVVYPVPKPKGFDPLAYVARYFSTIEINSTYYGSPLPATADKWVGRVEPFPDFKFTAKQKKPAAVPPPLMKAYPKELRGLAKPA